MSVYERRYNACFGQVSTYFDTLEELERLIVVYGKEPDWINEGYGDIGRQTEEYTEIIRRTIGPVRLTELRYEAQRTEVERLLFESYNQDRRET